jgi:hypothetical protein
MPLDPSPFDVDPSQPWQTQYAERLSRGINRGGPYVRRQIRVLLLGIAGIVALTLVAFVVTTVF